MIEWYVNTAWHKWWMEKVWKPSWSKFTSAIYGIPAALMAVGEYIAWLTNDSTVQMYLAKMHIPQAVPVALATVALIHYIASGRK